MRSLAGVLLSPLLWVLAGAGACAMLVLALHGPGLNPRHWRPAKDATPVQQARLAPGEEAVLGDITVFNRVWPPEPSSVVVRLRANRLEVQVAKGFSSSMSFPNGGGGGCENGGSGSNRFSCAVAPGSRVGVQAIKATIVYPTPTTAAP